YTSHRHRCGDRVYLVKYGLCQGSRSVAESQYTSFETGSRGDSLSRSQSTHPFISAQPGPSSSGLSGRSSTFRQFFRCITSMCKSIEDTQTVLVDQKRQIIARQDLQQVQLDRIWETLHPTPPPGPPPS
ncbi:hypothetical protein Ancab_001223, partial [Ancistrocladus abbreviatus]